MGAWHYLILAKVQINNLFKKETVSLRGSKSKKLPTSACLHQTLMFLRWAFVKWSHAFCLEAEWYTATICSTAASDQQWNQVRVASRDGKRRNKTHKRSIRLVVSSRMTLLDYGCVQKRLCVLECRDFIGDSKAEISIYTERKGNSRRFEVKWRQSFNTGSLYPFRQEWQGSWWFSAPDSAGHGVKQQTIPALFDCLLLS